jgi:hypothetical protein
MAACLTTADWRNVLTLRRGWRGRPAASPWFWAWLVAAMFLAQSLGLTHNVLHNAVPQGVHAWASLPAGTHEDADSSWLARLFPGHDNAADCRLYDQVSHSDGIPMAALLQFPVVHPPALTQVIQVLAPAKPTIRVQARGPPSFT